MSTFLEMLQILFSATFFGLKAENSIFETVIARC